MVYQYNRTAHRSENEWTVGPWSIMDKSLELTVEEMKQITQEHTESGLHKFQHHLNLSKLLGNNAVHGKALKKMRKSNATEIQGSGKLRWEERVRLWEGTQGPQKRRHRWGTDHAEYGGAVRNAKKSDLRKEQVKQITVCLYNEIVWSHKKKSSLWTNMGEISDMLFGGKKKGSKQYF